MARLLYWYCLAPFLFLSCCICHAADQRTLVFSSLPDKRLSTLMSQQVLVEAYRRIGVPIEFRPMPNSRVRELIAANALDGMDYRIAETLVGDLVKIPVPIAYEELVVFSTKENLSISGYGSLSDLSVGYITAAKVLDERVRAKFVDTAPDEESLFRKLAAGRTDIVIDSRSGLCLARQLGLTQVRINEPALDKLIAYHWLSGRHQRLIPRIVGALRDMERDGSLHAIQKRAMREFSATCGL